MPDRFTEHIYTFYTKDNNDLYEFHMPRHFNSKCPHISDNYEKLLPIMIENNIAKKVKILDSISYLVDAKGCRELVIKYLKDDIHAFDDDRELKKVKLINQIMVEVKSILTTNQISIDEFKHAFITGKARLVTLLSKNGNLVPFLFINYNGSNFNTNIYLETISELFENDVDLKELTELLISYF